jgi:membrane fusion protein (multidrug efflux system)
MLIMLVIVLLLVAALAGGFYMNIQKMIANSPKPSAQTISTVKAQKLEWQPMLSGVGTVVSARGVNVTTEIAGLVRSVEFHSGQDVKAGQVLVQLNADAEIATLNSLQAAADLAAVVLARDTAQLAFHGVSQAVVDADAADLKAKRANVAQQKATIDKKTIRAPFAGKVGITTVMPGQYLNTGDKIVTLQNLHPIYVDFSLPQQNLSRLARGQAVAVSTDAFPGQTFSGRISTINPILDPNTRNLQIEATVPNSKGQLLPGMYATVNVDVGTKATYLTLPQTAITYNPYGSTAFIVKKDDKSGPDGKTALVAQQVFVTTGETRGDQVAILKGIEEGQEVVSSGQLKLKTGATVIIDNTVQPANSPNPTPQEK